MSSFIKVVKPPFDYAESMYPTRMEIFPIISQNEIYLSTAVDTTLFVMFTNGANYREVTFHQ